ncbi:MAG: GNAT family N-acetyltransferase [Thomasclavelia sp.]|uniref:GNAT family N-acetyltransferase n=1 Tax=Thomasclavelia sp. TaxID=3025757 RepID=UPI0039A208AB
MGFKDVFNYDGEVEIGYGLGRDFEHNGYMTEAAQAFCNWALQQDEVKHIIAKTGVDGISSQKLLVRCGFKEYAKNDTVWWRL